MLTKELQPAAVNGILLNQSGDYQFNRSDLKSRPVGISFLNTGSATVTVKIGGLTFTLLSRQERVLSAPYGFYLKGQADFSFGSTGTPELTITTIEAL